MYILISIPKYHKNCKYFRKIFKSFIPISKLTYKIIRDIFYLNSKFVEKIMFNKKKYTENVKENLSEKIIRSNLTDDFPEIIIKNSVTSTNTELKNLVQKGISSKTVMISEIQTNGRGRGENSFFSPESGLYMSVLINSPDILKKSSHITTMAACSVYRAILKLTGIKTKIKWVNDIYLKKSKICGILAESFTDSNEKNIILGIGINLFPPDNGFPEDLKKKAGTLFKKYVPNIKNHLAAEILNQFFDIYNSENYKKHIDEYRKNSLLTGKKISFTFEGTVHSGTVIGIDEECRLIVKTKKNIKYLSSGEIKILKW